MCDLVVLVILWFRVMVVGGRGWLLSLMGLHRNYEPQSLARTAAASEPSSCKASVCTRSRFSAAAVRRCQVCTQTNSSVPTGNQAVSLNVVVGQC